MFDLKIHILVETFVFLSIIDNSTTHFIDFVCFTIYCS